MESTRCSWDGCTTTLRGGAVVGMWYCAQHARFLERLMPALTVVASQKHLAVAAIAQESAAMKLSSQQILDHVAMRIKREIRAGKTYRQLAQQAGVDHAFVFRLARKQIRLPTVDHIARILQSI